MGAIYITSVASEPRESASDAIIVAGTAVECEEVRVRLHCRGASASKSVEVDASGGWVARFAKEDGISAEACRGEVEVHAESTSGPAFWDNWSGFVVLEMLGAALLREEYLPILMLTGDTSQDVRHQALVLGVKDFLTKPLDLFEARYRIFNLLHTRFLHSELRQRATEQAP